VGAPPLNDVLLDHSELQEMNDRVQSINDIYEKQVMDGVAITDLTLLNTDKGSMGLTMDTFLDNALQERALGKLTAAEKKEKQRKAVMLRKDSGARISAGLMVITDGYAIGPYCLAWARRTRLDKERKAREKETAGRLERVKLKEKVDAVLAKGATPESGKWKKHDLKVMIQWFKRDGDKAMPKNKEGLLLRYRKTHTHVVQGTYPHEAAASASASHSVPSQPSCNTFAVAADGFQAAPYIAPTVVTITTAGVAIAVESAAVDSDLAHGATSAVDSDLAHGTTSDLQPNAPSKASPLDWDEEAPFDFGVQLTMDDPLFGVESEDESSDNDSIFVDLSRD
jgi:hypothetical protein